MTAKRFAFVVFTLAATLSLVVSTPVPADDGHDHGDVAAAPNAHGPQRLPDGSVFLPKPAQRQLGVRTLPIEAGELPRAFELNGVRDPLLDVLDAQRAQAGK